MLNKILTPENKAKLIEAAKKFGWRFVIYSIVAGSAFGMENLSLLNISPYLTVTIGFVLGEIHSWAQAQYDLQGRVAGAFRKAGKVAGAVFKK